MLILFVGLITTLFNPSIAATRQQDVATVQALIEAIDFIEEQPVERLHKMEQAFEKLNDKERAELLHAFKSCYKNLTHRGMPRVPQSLSSAMNEAGITSNSTISLRAHEQAKRKYTTLYIASNALTKSFLPDVFSNGREGKAVGILALCIGLLSGAFIGSTLKVNGTSSYTSLWLGVFAGLGAGGITYAARKHGYTKNQSQRIAQFIEHTWPTIREAIAFPEHVVSVLDYLYGKMEAGTFDMAEATNCIDALLEPGKVV